MDDLSTIVESYMAYLGVDSKMANITFIIFKTTQKHVLKVLNIELPASVKHDKSDSKHFKITPKHVLKGNKIKCFSPPLIGFVIQLSRRCLF